MSDLFVTTLDIPTLAFVRGLVQVMLGGLLLYLGSQDVQARGARLWAMGFFLNGLSLFVFPLSVPPEWETFRTVVNHLSLCTSSAFLYWGFCVFGRQRVHWWIPILLIVIPIVSLVSWEVLWPNSRYRILTTASSQLIFLIALQHSLRAAPRAELLTVYRRLRWVVIAYTALYVWSYGSIVELLPTTARVAPNYHRVIFSVSTLLFMLSLAVGCLALQFLLVAARNADLARIDWLTGLLNRRGFFDAASAKEQINAGDGSVVVLDIDHFKRINDDCGHATGDHVLQFLGAQILELVKADDLAARMGGEEFCIVLPGKDLDAASALAERIRSRCARFRQTTEDGETVRFSLSAGVTSLLAGRQLERSLANADAALYEAKQAGRDRVIVRSGAEGSLGKGCETQGHETSIC